MLTAQTTSRVLFVLVGLLMALTPIRTAIAAPAVTTNISMPYYSGGELRATFRATPLTDGTWQIEAAIKAHNILVPDNVWGSSYGYSRIRGTATAMVTVATGVSTSVGAGGLYYISGWSLYPIVHVGVYFDLTVSADGVVSVQHMGL